MTALLPSAAQFSLAGWFPSAAAALDGLPAPGAGGAPLNNSEREVMKALALGMMHKEIAARFGWSGAKENRIQHSAYDKLNAHARTDALNRWRQINAPPTAPAQ
jgi:DNA-binding NarL/FixJ family response regulator